MDQPTFNQFLTGAVQSGASDIHFKPQATPAVRVNGELRQVRVPALRPEDTAQIADHILRQSRWDGEMSALREVDASYTIDGVGRFRSSIFRTMGSVGIIMRAIPPAVPELAQLGLPAVAAAIASEERGLILVTGVTGSGKTSTLAALVNHINANASRHIITIEDPIEFLHQDIKSRITQREIGPDTGSFGDALRAALRQDPDVILVGEMRDLETIDIALKAAETGHLVLSTTHTTDAARTISRILGVYPADAQPGVRQRLSEILRASISQRLLPRADGQGRALAVEVLVNNVTIGELIRNPERTAEIPESLARGHDVYGTQSFDQHLAELVRTGTITLEVGKDAASSPSDFERAFTLGV